MTLATPPATTTAHHNQTCPTRQSNIHVRPALYQTPAPEMRHSTPPWMLPTNTSLIGWLCLSAHGGVPGVSNPYREVGCVFLSVYGWSISKRRLLGICIHCYSWLCHCFVFASQLAMSTTCTVSLIRVFWANLAPPAEVTQLYVAICYGGVTRLVPLPPSCFVLLAS